MAGCDTEGLMGIDRDEAEVTLSVKWSEGAQPQKSKRELEKVLQTWANNYAKETKKPQECTVCKILEDGRAVLRIRPAPAKRKLQELIGQTLPRKDGKTITITSVSLTSSELETLKPKEASLDFLPSFALELQDLEGQLGEQSSDMTTSTCNIPLHHYWYVTQNYKEEIERIEKESGVKIVPEVKLTFEADGEDGNQSYAFSEFTNLVQKCSAESRGFAVPLKKVNPEALKDTLKIIQRPENKLLLTLSSEVMNTFGPRQNQDAIRKSLNATHKTLTNTTNSAGESAQTSQEQTLNINISIEDPHAPTGPAMGERNRKVMATSLDKQEAKINQRPEEASVDLPPSLEPEPQDEQMPPVEESNFSSSAAVSTAEKETCSCSLPVNNFWYVNHIYAKEIKKIEKKNGVTMDAEMTVTFRVHQKDGGPQEALSEFTDLTQKCLDESEDSVFPLKYVEPEELKDALRIIQRPENKLLLTLSSEAVTVSGPRQSQDAINKSLNLMQKTLTNAITSAVESAQTSQDSSANIGLSINDQSTETKAKLVDFKVSGIHQGKVEVKARYNRARRNMVMQSHSVIPCQYQGSIKICPKPVGAMAVRPRRPPEIVSNVHQLGKAFSGPALTGQSKYSTRNTDAPTDEGATAGDNKDEKCPICIDTFTKKTQLKCKHEFCEECLERAKKVLGSICPVCREVYGMIEGDQPDGHMSSSSSPISLPGYSNCGSITITYNIPSGIQMEKHPNPGQFYSGIHRTAYLPDNKEGREVLKLLKEAFDRRLIFTIGTSRTTGRDNQVIWTDIHHKTSTIGGPENFGYPDPDYLYRVRDELKAKGIK